MITGIAAQATAMKHQQLQEQVAVQTMKMSMDTAKQQGEMLDKLLSSVNDSNLGNFLDVKG